MLSRNSLICANPQNLTKVFKTKLSHSPNLCQLNPFARWHLTSLRLVLKLSARSSFTLLNPLFHFWFPLKIFCAFLCVQITNAPWLRNKSYLTQGSAYPTSPNCPSGTNRHSSHSTAISPKPTDGTNPRSAKQQAIAKKMDTWCDHLSQRRWTSPTLPPTRINALAHRDNNKSFSDC